MSIVKPSSGWKRTVLLSIGLFFPAFIFSIPLTMVWQQLHWPYDWQFRHDAVAVSFCVGVMATISSLIWGLAGRSQRLPQALLLGTLIRASSGMLGLSAACMTLVIPILFLANTFQEGKSVKQYGGHSSLSGTLGGITLVLLISGLFGLGAFILLRFCFRGRTAVGVHHRSQNS